jgi:hypothetical protein
MGRVFEARERAKATERRIGGPQGSAHLWVAPVLRFVARFIAGFHSPLGELFASPFSKRRRARIRSGYSCAGARSFVLLNATFSGG